MPDDPMRERAEALVTSLFGDGPFMHRAENLAIITRALSLARREGMEAAAKIAGDFLDETAARHAAQASEMESYSMGNPAAPREQRDIARVLRISAAAIRQLSAAPPVTPPAGSEASER